MWSIMEVLKNTNWLVKYPKKKTNIQMSTQERAMIQICQCMASPQNLSESSSLLILQYLKKIISQMTWL